ncbi:DUF1772 domain-containing protein [Paracoccus pacificus]|uniref:DUF1772 domain-containing protein n=1 Tax=Paracoccus pacificus TaxID=1463598 RepID=A0ABW4RAZ6_9RHOB
MLMIMPLLSLLFTGAIFGFFFAWVCSTMWGLDATDPAVAIQAMQAMNASVLNLVFATVFFGTPVVLALTAFVVRAQSGTAALAFLAAALVYGLGGLVLTMAVNVPMNQALAAIPVPADPAEAKRIWTEFSGRWQFWNQIRTVASGLALLLAGWATLQL